MKCLSQEGSWWQSQLVAAQAIHKVCNQHSREEHKRSHPKSPKERNGKEQSFHAGEAHLGSLVNSFHPGGRILPGSCWSLQLKHPGIPTGQLQPGVPTFPSTLPLQTSAKNQSWETGTVSSPRVRWDSGFSFFSFKASVQSDSPQCLHYCRISHFHLNLQSFLCWGSAFAPQLLQLGFVPSASLDNKQMAWGYTQIRRDRKYSKFQSGNSPSSQTFDSLLLPITFQKINLGRGRL